MAGGLWYMAGGLLPEKIQVRRLELPAGKYELTLQPIGRHNQSLGRLSTTTVHVDDGRNTYVLGSFPDANLVGRIVSSAGP